MIKNESDRIGDEITKGLFWFLGLVFIIIPISIFYSLIFYINMELLLFDLSLRIILAVVFLVMGLGTLLFLRRRHEVNQEEEFWDSLKQKHILDVRFAKGEISELEYEEMKQVLEGVME